jgi:6-phosphogluconolactonase
VIHAHTLPDEPAVVALAVDEIRAAAHEALLRRGRFLLGLTGGSAAARIYPALGRSTLDWTRIHLFWGDERCVPPTDPESNYGLARRLFIDSIGIPDANVHRMKGEAADPDAAAAAYAAELLRETEETGTLDLIHLGMGPDGHVCSLFPGHPLLQERHRLVAPVLDSPKPPPRRLTLTLPALHAARVLLLTVTGPEKAAATTQILKDARASLPAALAAAGPAPLSLLADRAAMGSGADQG